VPTKLYRSPSHPLSSAVAVAVAVAVNDHVNVDDYER
jgi:hypothetical protein